MSNNSTLLNDDVLKLFSNPVSWCEAFLRDPNHKEEPLTLASYQKHVLLNSRKNRRLLLCWGRRLGKSVTLCVDTLWWCSVYPLVKMLEEGKKEQQSFRVLIATPYDNQINELWNTYSSLIADSPLLSKSVSKIRTSDPQIIEFDNGSSIEGHTIGISSSNRGTSLRSLSADMVFLDEMDFIPREIIEQAIMPIWTTHANCMLRIASTPSGKRELFWEWFTRANELGWYVSHHPSWHPDNKRWVSIEQAKLKGIPVTESTEFQVRAITDSASFDREYGAIFGEEFGGVYKQLYVNKSIINYGPDINLDDPDIFDPKFECNPNNLYIIGVDWNSFVNGGQIVVVEYCRVPTVYSYFNHEEKKQVNIDFTGKYRLFYRKGIKVKESTQRATRNEIIRLMRAFKIDYVYVDYGHGDTNIEELTLFGKENPELDMARKLRIIDSGASVEHYDPLLRKTIKKRNKSLMVGVSALNLEEQLYLLPREEDKQTRLVGQMRGYKIKNVTSRGDYTYEGDDHILDAFNLAVYGFQKEYGSLLNNRLVYNILFLNDPRINEYPKRESAVDNPIFKQTSKIRDPEKPISPKRSMMPHMVRGIIRRPNLNTHSIGGLSGRPNI